MPRKPKTKKVLVLLGSPRKKGNSTALAERIIKGAEAAGASVERIYLFMARIYHLVMRVTGAERRTPKDA